MKTSVIKKIEINKDLVLQYFSVFSHAAKLGTKIEARIDYIIRKIYETFDSTLTYWWWDSYQDRGESSLYERFTEGSTTITGYCTESTGLKDEPVIILNDGSEWELYEFPTRWLYENFEEELTLGKQKFLDKIESGRKEKAAKKLKRAKENAKKKTAALAKLTKEEKRILGIK